MNICFTGKMMVNGEWMTRAMVKAMIENSGHTFHPSVKNGTDILVSGVQIDGRTATTKIKKAERYGVRVIDCDEAEILLSGNGYITERGYEEEL